MGIDTLVNIENISGTPFSDTLTGDNNNNWLWGSTVWSEGSVISTTNNDTLDGDGGDDLLTVGIGSHTLIGGSGNDTLVYAENGGTEVGVEIDLALQGAAQATGAGSWTLSGIENLVSGTGDDSLSGDDNANLLAGNIGADTLIGGAGDDTLLGDGAVYVDNGQVVHTLTDSGADGGDDLLDGGLGDDQLYGGAGSDTATYAGAGGSISAYLYGDGTGDAYGADGHDQLHDIENVIGSAYDDDIEGNDLANVFDGGAGNDFLRGAGGDDTLYGGDGSDILKGQAGDDLIDGGAGTDRAGYYQSDPAIGGVTVDLRIAGPQDTGSMGWDTLVGIENVFGTPFADNLTGDDGDNWLSGSEATIEGVGVSATNNDTLDGQGGNDLLEVGIGNHTLTGGSGIDTVSFTENGYPETGVTIELNLQGGAQDTGNGSWTLNGIENLSGGTANDTLSGNFSANTLAGNLGNDILNGFGGDDLLLGDGRIAVNADGVITTFFDSGSEGGNDSLNGGAGNDTLYGGAGLDSLGGAAGNDTLYGGDGDDLVSGGVGDDLIDGGAGTDRASFFNGATSGVTVDLRIAGVQNTGVGLDTLVNIENLSGTSFADTLTGDGGNNWLYGSASGGGAANNDTLDGQGGNDLLAVGIGNHALSGGSGVDTVSFSENGGAEPNLIVSLASQVGMQATGAGNWTLDGIENLSGGAGADNLTGDGNVNVLAGDVGNDILSGGGGNDILYGDGRIGIDFQGLGGSGPITTYSDVGVTFGVADGDDTLEGGLGNDTLNGGGGSDTASYASAGGGVTVNLAFGTSGAAGSDTLVSIENILGSTFNDTLIGDGVDNVITGGLGHDFLRGLGGNDTLVGSDGDDYLDGGQGDDILDGGAGFDRLSYFGSATGPVTVDLRIQGFAQNTGQGMDTLIGIEHVGGTQFGDTLVGDDNANWIRGSSTGGDADTIDGQGGDDLIEDGAGDHVLQGGAGTDTFTFVGLVGGPGINVSLAAQSAAQDTGAGLMTLSGFENLSGSGNADTLIGDGGANILAGSGGNDNLAGGASNDELYGDGQFNIDTHGTLLSGPIILQADGGGAGNDTLDGGLGDDFLNGGGGSDTASYASAGGGVVVDLGSGTASGAADNDTLVSIENVTGSAYDDTLSGDAGNNVIDGGAGQDILQFSGNRVDYAATAGVGGTVVVAGGADGTDTTTNVEVYRFADGDFAWDAGTNSLLLLSSGVVADGYVASATIFIDIDRDGTFDNGVEPFTISDANGNFVLASNAVGPLRAIGGTNVDTGLANVLTLSAPEGSAVINPLTTLVEALVAGGASEAAAEAQVLAGLGLDPSLDLTTFDILAAPAGDAAALAAQKAAASIAELLQTIVETGGSGAQAAGVASLAGAVAAADGAGSTLDLTDNATLTDVLSDALPGVPPAQIAELAAATQAVNTAIEAATDLGDVSDAQGNAAPTIAAIDAGVTNEDAAVKTINLLTGAQDADGDTVAVASIVSAVTGTGLPVSTSLNGNILSINPAQFNALAVGESRTVSVTYRISDGHGGLTANTATLVVNGVNDSPTAGNDTASVVEDRSVTGNVRSNDSDPDTTDVTAVSGLAFGATTGAVGTPLAGLYGTLTLAANGTYSYAADADYLDTLRGVTGLRDVFTYTLSDGHGGTTTATLTVNVSLAADERTINGTVNSDVIHGDQLGLIGAEDTIFGGKGNDQLFGEDGADTLWGGAGDDSLSGGQSRDTLYGEDGNDALNGGAGNDWLEGGGGNDRLTGGSGADTYVFAKSGGADTITDFQSGTDHIKLDGVTVKSSTFSDVDHSGTLDLVLQLSSGSVTLLNVSTPLPAGTFVTSSSAARTTQDMLSASSSMATSAALVGAVAAAGLAAVPAADAFSATLTLPGSDSFVAGSSSVGTAPFGAATFQAAPASHLDANPLIIGSTLVDAAHAKSPESSASFEAASLVGRDTHSTTVPTPLLQATDAPTVAHHFAPMATGVMIPENLHMLGNSEAAPGNVDPTHSNALVRQVLADALHGGAGLNVDALLHALPGTDRAAPTAGAGVHAMMDAMADDSGGWAMAAMGSFGGHLPMEALALHPDAGPFMTS
jgi:VCBS repeat-containing protein